jgi:hypothetical protein
MRPRTIQHARWDAEELHFRFLYLEKPDLLALFSMIDW